MKVKRSFITNSSTTAHIMVGKKITFEEFKSSVEKGDFSKLVAIEIEADYEKYPFRDDKEELIKIAETANAEKNYLFYEYVLGGSSDWAVEEISLAKLKGIEDIENYRIVLHGTGGAC